jgi:arylsulfatase
MGADGVIVAQADYLGGYSLYVLDGKPSFTYSFMGITETTIVSSETLSPGPATIRYEFTADHPGTPGGGGTSKLFVNGKQVAEGRLEKTIPSRFSGYAGFDIGRDNGLPVVRKGPYAQRAPFPFDGTITKVVFDLK